MKMKKLDHLASAARESDPTWDDVRAERVFSSAVTRKERRASRNRLARRAMVAASVVGMLGLVFLRGANASSSSSSSSEHEPSSAIAAADTLGDAGYARD
jgi:hypothetical protein